MSSMMPSWLYYFAASLLLLNNLCGFALNFLALPGNWLIVGGSALFCLFVHSRSGLSLSWQAVGLLCLLALAGEAVEFAAGMVGAAQLGASRRSLVLSMIGSIAGSVVGAMFGVAIPVPLLGPALGALAGGAVGAAMGVLLGEGWKGRATGDSLRVGAGAFVGRVLGTVGKLALGAAMCVIATIDSLW